ncbi:MAG: archaea-specific RecJ-like exonuclease [Candidatus Argoarchaeum ethanivorans]|uniref:Archaea-specific RecJ-like exonuclease n=1 Tax=Candidatus Argoarchaeum ethanivorans TaxID=2608793 RepID=A0A8B3RYY3_9EURY|nr:MAG: archaea-specific RecJ-like exonuclease [Candidatus Argoarchaeum ethanivorans]
MSECSKCKGTGFIVEGETVCPVCHGSGKVKSVDLTSLNEEDLPGLLSGDLNCKKCGGTGKIPVKNRCEKCNGSGVIVHKLHNACDLADVETGELYEGVVGDVVAFGAFVYLNSSIKGLAHSSKLKREPSRADKMIVEVRSIQANGNIELVPVSVSNYFLVEVKKNLTRQLSSKLIDFVGKQILVSGEVIQVKQTGGPTIFTIGDEGGLIHCAAFEKAGERAYPEIDSGMIVAVMGEANLRNSEIQIEVHDISPLSSSEAVEIKKQIDGAIRKRAKPSSTKFLIQSQILEKLHPEMVKVAEEIRYAVLTSRRIILRHHADADGITAAIAIERAILPLIREVGGMDAEYRFFKRAPSKAPFYELEDITKDLTFALEDKVRFGQKLPLIVLMDNGSTEEDVPAMLQAKVYGLDIIVVDHHHPDKIVDQYLLSHVNPAYAGGDFGVTAGMLGFEIARMILPEVTDEIKHFPAVSAIGDRSQAPEAEAYIKLASDKYTREELTNIALAIDYEAYWQRFNDGRGIMNDILNLGNVTTHRKIVELLCKQANSAIAEQLETCMQNVKSTQLPNSAILNVIDVENYAHKFTFPPPGKTSGEIHDRLCRKYDGKPVVTIGYGPDFAVIRSKGVLLNIPQMVRELRDEMKGAGVNGGGHLVVGSVKFVGGMRREVLQKLAEKIGKAGIE